MAWPGVTVQATRRSLHALTAENYDLSCHQINGEAELTRPKLDRI